METPSALIILFDGVEEMEAVASIDCLRRAGVDVTTAATGDDLTVVGRNQIHLAADRLLKDCPQTGYRLLVVPGGPGHASLLENDTVLDRLRLHQEAGGLIGSICAGPVVLQAAGLLQGKAFTSFPATADILPDRNPDRPVVRDGNLITSQGAGTATRFALELVEALCGAQRRQEVAASICYTT